jgi:hypothetical protein
MAVAQISRIDDLDLISVLLGCTSGLQSQWAASGSARDQPRIFAYFHPKARKSNFHQRGLAQSLESVDCTSFDSAMLVLSICSSAVSTDEQRLDERISALAGKPNPSLSASSNGSIGLSHLGTEPLAT